MWCTESIRVMNNLIQGMYMRSGKIIFQTVAQLFLTDDVPDVDRQYEPQSPSSPPFLVLSCKAINISGVL